MTDREWIANLKPGDEVIVVAGSALGRSDYVTKVERITKTLIITSKGGRFRRFDGDQLGEGYGRPYLQELTQERVDNIRQKNLSNHFKRFDWSKQSLEKLLKVRDILQTP